MKQPSPALIPVLFVALALPAPARAQEEGVFVDPDSPAGKEYAIPFEAARRGVAPERDGRTSPPLFGEGVSDGGGSAATGGALPASPQTGATPIPPTLGGSPPPPAGERPGLPLTEDSGSVEELWTLGLPAAILVAGAAAGLVLRRRSPRPVP